MVEECPHMRGDDIPIEMCYLNGRVSVQKTKLVELEEGVEVLLFCVVANGEGYWQARTLGFAITEPRFADLRESVIHAVVGIAAAFHRGFGVES
jgi:hypothetical protein